MKITNATKSAEWAPEDYDTLLRYLMGGTLVGGGLGALTGLAAQARMLDTHSQARKRIQEAIIPLEIPRPGQKRDGDLNEKNAMSAIFTPDALGIAGSLTSGVAAYALARKVFAALRRREVAQRLADANEGYNEALTGAVDQSAGVKIANSVFQPQQPSRDMSLVWGLAAAGVPLAAILSATASRRILDKAFPAPKNMLATEERKMFRLQRPGEKQKAEEHGSDDAVKAAGAELLLALTSADKSPLVDDNSLIKGWVGAVGAGALDDLETAVNTKSASAVELADAVTKFASHYGTMTPGERVTAGLAILHESPFGAAFANDLALEVANKLPLALKEASAIFEESPEAHETAVKLAGALGRGFTVSYIAHEALGKDFIIPAGGCEKNASVMRTPFMKVFQQLRQRNAARAGAPSKPQGKDMTVADSHPDDVKNDGGEDTAKSDTVGRPPPKDQVDTIMDAMTSSSFAQ